MNPLPNDEQMPAESVLLTPEHFRVLNDQIDTLFLDLQALKVRYAASESALAAAEKRLLEAEEDTKRLNFLIKEGPPGAARSIGLNEELWDQATTELDESGEDTDNRAVRAAIDHAMNPAP